jgi:lipopolysaccharide transport system ATP-binding protein
MSDLALRVEGLSKEYHIGKQIERYQTLRDTLTATFWAPWRRAGQLLRGHASGAAELDETIWALQDVSFDVQQGEVVGIIGRNGAGKSTLLKILSRITEPTRGRAEILGRIGTLLEVGTGFHPELTGRENIYLNGAILGMKRTEIERNFDPIVAFAEVEKFLDTPVKHYSSGMYLRLAFSVAAHLEPEILLVDEVLAVGDTAFQRKCLGKMSDVAQEGRTVLFISHNMSAIRSLCDRAILIEMGRVKHDGDIFSAVAMYHGLVQSGESQSPLQAITFTNMHLNGRKRLSIKNDEPIEITFTLTISIDLIFARLRCLIRDAEGNIVLHHHIEHYELLDELKPGYYQIKIQIPALWLRPDAYTLHFRMHAHAMGTSGRYDSDGVIIDVLPSNDSFADFPAMIGLLNPPVTWSVESVEHR